METAIIHFRGVLQPAHAARAQVLYDLEHDGLLSADHRAEIPRHDFHACGRANDLATPTAFGIAPPMPRPLIEHYYAEAAPFLANISDAQTSAYCEFPVSRAVPIDQRRS
jgi:hypothetical protein